MTSLPCLDLAALRSDICASRKFQLRLQARLMALVTIKDKFQVTIPARLRDQVAVAVGDILDASVENGAIVLRPKAVVDRAILAARLDDLLAAAPVAPEFAGQSEEQVLDEVSAEIEAERASRRRPER